MYYNPHCYYDDDVDVKIGVCSKHDVGGGVKDKDEYNDDANSIMAMVE